MIVVFPRHVTSIDHGALPDNLALARRYTSPNLPNVPVGATVGIVIGVVLLVVGGTWLCTRRMAARDRCLKEARALRDRIALAPSTRISPASAASEVPMRAGNGETDALPRYETRELSLPTYAEAEGLPSR
ncbi:hypothetical protein CONPUDRAFT_140310 [Coniophora puteana RWD-64-598 SS2]|uniref:Uncharacterized protein n=1 Tax=Coniophora puteana (strain RWD-64-598) TaxID=741705 RepID=A0A5M3M8E2_CONPW|nr:uncharacterized protein CONPUDRAFT_140310 [Coniophora puteana RWD-64-598 SS2]EIW74941.1 hypothetical protein CONPUDRAFT_140310 [Coniophora puteana RWD-64-598 SS2]